MKKHWLRLILILLGVVLLAGAWVMLRYGGQIERDHYIRTGRVVLTHGMVDNLPVLTGFFSNALPQEGEAIQLVTYTVEGDPIFSEVRWQNGQYIYQEDASRDRYGGGSRSSQQAYQHVMVQQQGNTTNYTLYNGSDFDWALTQGQQQSVQVASYWQQ